MTIFFIGENVLFYQIQDGTIMPHIKIVHRYPWMLRQMQIDKGGLKHIIGGSDVMVPGLISATGKFGMQTHFLISYLDERAEKGDVVAVMGEGKTHAIAVGVMQIDGEDFPIKKTGIAIEVKHHLGDALWVYKVDN